MKVPNETLELVSLSKYLDNVRQVEMVKISEQLKEAKKRMEFLLDHSFISEDDMKLNIATFTWTQRINPVLDLSRKRIVQRKVKAQEDLKTKIESISKEVDVVYDQVIKFKASNFFTSFTSRTLVWPVSLLNFSPRSIM